MVKTTNQYIYIWTINWGLSIAHVLQEASAKLLLVSDSFFGYISGAMLHAKSRSTLRMTTSVKLGDIVRCFFFTWLIHRLNSKVLEYIPTFGPFFWVNIGKYFSTMEHLGIVVQHAWNGLCLFRGAECGMWTSSWQNCREIPSSSEVSNLIPVDCDDQTTIT